MSREKFYWISPKSENTSSICWKTYDILLSFSHLSKSEINVGTIQKENNKKSFSLIINLFLMTLGRKKIVQQSSINLQKLWKLRSIIISDKNKNK